MNVYLKAAKLMHKWAAHECNGCCDAIYQSIDDPCYGNATREFTWLFRPNTYSCPYWGILWGGKIQEAKECRVLALCFAAAMHSTGDL